MSTSLTNTLRQWVWLRRALASIITIVLAVFGMVQTGLAEGIVNDAYIDEVTFDVADPTLGATTTYTVTFTTNTTINAGTGIIFDVGSSTGCFAPDWNACTPDFTNATVSGIGNDIMSQGRHILEFVPTSNLPAGTYTVMVGNVVNQISAGALRPRVSTGASDESQLPDFDQTNWYVTSSTNAVDMGDVVVRGTVLIPSGTDVYPNAWVHVFNENHSIEKGANSDEKGYYAIFANYDAPGFWQAGTFTVEVFPRENSGFITTQSNFAYSGSAVTKNITLSAAEYYFTGKVVYGSKETDTVSADAGDAVTNARVVFNNETGGGYFANTGADGNFVVSVASGTGYMIYVEPNVDRRDADALAEVDWQYFSSPDQRYSITEKGNTSVGTIEVEPTNAFVTGTVTAPDAYGEIYGHVNLRKADAMKGGPGTEYFTYIDLGSFAVNLNAGVYKMTFNPDVFRNSALAPLFFSSTLTVEEGVNDPIEIELQELTSVVNFTVQDEDGNPLNNIDTNVWTDGHWANSRTTAGQSAIYIQSNVQYEANVWSQNHISQSEPARFKLAENESKDLVFVMQAPDANIEVRALDPNGNLAQVSGHAWCETKDHSRQSNRQLQAGTATIPVVVDSETGVFSGECNIWLLPGNEFGTTGSVDVSVADGEIAPAVFSLVARNATIRVVVKNLDTGKKVPADPSVFVSVSNPKNVWYDSQLNTNPVDIQVPSDMKWFGGIWCQDCNLIPIWSMNTDVVTSNALKVKILVQNVLEKDGSVHVTVTGPDGNPLQYGGVHCGNWASVDLELDTVKKKTAIETWKELHNGEADVSLVSGNTYDCGVGLPPEVSEQGLIAPAEKRVEFPSADQQPDDITFKLKESNAFLTGSISLDAGVTSISSVDDIDNVWCWAWGKDAGQSWDEAAIGKDYRLNLFSGTRWVAGCDAQDFDNKKWYWAEEYEFEAEEGENIHPIILKESSWTPYDVMTETFDAATTKVMTYYDGTIVTMPAGTIATEGNVTVAINQEFQIARNETANPLQAPKDFEAFDSENQLIETFNGNVTIAIPYTDEDLEAVGVTENGIIGKFKDDSNMWQLPDNVTNDTVNNKIIITTNHFTEFGIMYNGTKAKVSKPNRPRRLQAKEISFDAALLTWKRPKNASVSKYRVQVREYKQLQSKTWKQYGNVKKVQRRVHKLEPNTKYQFRVRAVNAVGKSKFSGWERFKTEPAS